MHYKLLTHLIPIFKKPLKSEKMKNLIIVLCFLFSGIGFAQQKQNKENQRNNKNTTQENKEQQDRPNWYEVRDTAEYVSNKEKYILIREGMDIKVFEKKPTGEQVEYGNLKRVSSQGFFVLTSPTSDEVAFGSFNEKGNLNIIRYDRTQDTLVPQEFISPDPIERAGSFPELRQNNRGTNNQGNINQNNN
jgi:hypothetical protein